MGVLDEWSKLFYQGLLLGSTAHSLWIDCRTVYVLCDPQVNCKILLKSAGLLESFWLLALSCVVYRHFTIEKLPELWRTVRARKNLAALNHELFQEGSHIWSIYIPFWLTYLHSSSLRKQNSSSDLLKLAVTGNFRFIRDFTNKCLSSFRKNEWSESKNHGFSQYFLWLLFLKDLQKIVCLKREDKWRYFGQTGM